MLGEICSTFFKILPFLSLKTQYFPLCFTRLSCCFGFHGSEASIDQRAQCIMGNTGSLSAITINQLSHEETGGVNGVLREVFSLVWNDFHESHVLGESERVPYLQHDFDRNKWEAVGRILVK